MNTNYTIGQFENMCRTCMYIKTPADDETTFETDVRQVEQQQQEQTRDLKSIVTNIGDNEKLKIVEMLLITTPELLVEVNDELPQLVCMICVEKLLELQKFRTMCRRSDQFMRGLLEKNKSTEQQMQNIEEVECVVVISNGNVNYIDEQEPECRTSLNSIDDGEVPEREPKITKESSISEGEVRVASEMNKHACDQCSGCFVDAAYLLQHKQLHHKGFPFRCENCGKKFKLRESLKQHKKTHEATADGCKLRETPESSKSKRTETENGKLQVKQKNFGVGRTGRYPCDQCPRVYVGLKCLLRHKQTHAANSSGYECKNCGKQFELRQSLTRHKATHEATADGCKRRELPKTHICKYCNKGFQLLRTLREHTRTHTGEQPYLCPECGKSFSSASNMTEHRRRHAGEKRYECPECPKKFICYSNFFAHRTVHTKIKSHVCDVCGAGFCKQAQLRKHKIYHTNDKRFKCDFCDMRFFRADHMRRHQRTHTGERPCKCEYCERTFTQRNELIKHWRSHLGEKVYKCEMCPQRFRMAGELRVHFAEHKNDDDETRERNLKELHEAEKQLSADLAKANNT